MKAMMQPKRSSGMLRRATGDRASQAKAADSIERCR
jgi:hypothetical protein